MIYTHPYQYYPLNFRVTKAKVKKALKKLDQPETENSIKHILELMQGTAQIELDYHLGEPMDTLKGLWDDDDKPAKLTSAATPKSMYMVQLNIPYSSLDEVLETMGYRINKRNVEYLLGLLEFLSQSMIDVDIEDYELLFDRY